MHRQNPDLHYINLQTLAGKHVEVDHFVLYMTKPPFLPSNIK